MVAQPMQARFKLRQQGLALTDPDLAALAPVLTCLYQHFVAAAKLSRANLFAQPDAMFGCIGLHLKEQLLSYSALHYCLPFSLSAGEIAPAWFRDIMFQLLSPNIFQ